MSILDDYIIILGIIDNLHDFYNLKDKNTLPESDKTNNPNLSTDENKADENKADKNKIDENKVDENSDVQDSNYDTDEPNEQTESNEQAELNDENQNEKDFSEEKKDIFKIYKFYKLFYLSLIKEKGIDYNKFPYTNILFNTYFSNNLDKISEDPKNVIITDDQEEQNYIEILKKILKIIFQMM